MLSRARLRSALALPLAEARAEVPKDRLVHTRRGTLHVTVTGEGPPVVLLHGVTDNAATFDELVPRLATVARVHALDLPGHGLSDIPSSPLGVFDMADAVRAYLDAASIARAVVVGWSMGGGVALALAAAAPDRVSALVLVGSIGLPFPMPRNLGLLRVPGAGEAMSLLAGSARLRRVLIRDTFHERFTPSVAVIDRYWRPWRVRGRAPYMRALLTTTLAAERERIPPLLRHLHLPVEVLHGDGDRIVPVAIGRGLARHLPRATLHVLAGAGHSPHIESPDPVAAAVRRALAHG